MSKYTRRLGTPIVIAAFTVFAACSSDAKKGPDSVALGTDSTLNKRSCARGSRLDRAAAAQRRSGGSTGVDGQEERSGSDDAARADASCAAENDSAGHDDDAQWQHGDDEFEDGRWQDSRRRRCRNDPGRRDAHHERLVEDLHRHERGRRSRHGDGSTNAVTGSNGATIPAGATVNMTVTALKRSENANDKIVMEFAVNSVSFEGRPTRSKRR